MRKFSSYIGFVLVAAPLAPSSSAQCPPFYTFTGATSGDQLGRSIATAGDLNGDGSPDLIVGAPEEDPFGLVSAGTVRAFSGASGAPIYPFPLMGSAAGDKLGYSVGNVGDVNADGSSDFVVGAPEADPGGLLTAGQAKVISGATGTVVYTLNGSVGGMRLGYSVAGTGDVDGDGIPDFVVGSLVNEARVYSGATGGLLYTLAPGYGLFGQAVAGAGDVNADGNADLVVGAPGSQVALVYSGATGNTLYTLAAAFALFGSAVCGAGDLDGDGDGEVVVGAPGSNFVRVYSGASGGILYTFSGGASFGESVAGGGDMNGDGVPDIMVGAPFCCTSGQIHLFSGASGLPTGLFGTVNGTTPSEGLGASVAMVSDLNGDGLVEIFAGAPYAAGGRAQVFVVGLPPGGSFFGAGCLGSGGIVPQVGATGGGPCVGNGAFQIVLHQALGGTIAQLALGFSSTSFMGVPLPMNLTPLGVPGCQLLVSPDFLITTTTNGIGAGNGAALILIPIPPVPALAGLSVYFQWYVVDPGPIPLPGAMSQALQVTILP